jgi:carboxylesterase
VPVLPGAEPFTADGHGPLGRTGVVVVHGFTGTVQSVRPWAASLAEAGLAVRAPLLPGHGTRWQDMNRTRWTDWYAEVERAFDDLRARCDTVFVAGLSMGGTLALRLLEERGGQVAGGVLVNASLVTLRREAKVARVLQWVLPSVPPISRDIAKQGVPEVAYERTPVRAFVSLTDLWRLTRRDLDLVTQPLLVYRSRVDHVVEPVSCRLLLEGVRTREVEERVLERSYHVATLDYDAEEIFAGTLAFVRAHPPATATGDAATGDAATTDAATTPAGATRPAQTSAAR